MYLTKFRKKKSSINKREILWKDVLQGRLVGSPV